MTWQKDNLSRKIVKFSERQTFLTPDTYTYANFAYLLNAYRKMEKESQLLSLFWDVLQILIQMTREFKQINQLHRGGIEVN